MKLEIKPGSGVTTSEFWFSIVKVGFCAAIVLGFVDPEYMQQGALVVQQGASSISDLAQTAGSPDGMSGILDTVFKGVALIVGGNVASNYTKARGVSKSKKDNGEDV